MYTKTHTSEDCNQSEDRTCAHKLIKLEKKFTTLYNTELKLFKLLINSGIPKSQRTTKIEEKVKNFVN